MEGRLTEREIALAQRCIRFAREAGAAAVRITLNKSLTNLVGMLSGEVDKVSRSLDRNLTVHLFVDGRFGSFSINRLDDEDVVRDFILDAAENWRKDSPCFPRRESIPTASTTR